jgi:hypothetical protein
MLEKCIHLHLHTTIEPNTDEALLMSFVFSKAFKKMLLKVFYEDYFVCFCCMFLVNILLLWLMMLSGTGTCG